jgi:lysophospholipase L1-like esterase
MKKEQKKIKNNKENKEEMSLTKQQHFNFETNEFEYDENFIKKVKNSKKEKVIIVEKKIYPKYLLSFLIIIILSFICFNVYHFNTYNHTQIKKVVSKNKIDNNYVFVGDSITYMYDLNKYYEGMHVVNSGGDGNQTSDVLSNMNNRIYRYNPSKVFLLIGTNDIAHDKSKEEIVENIKKIVKGIKENRPSCKIYVESIYPVNNTDDEKISMHMVKNRTNEEIQKINADLKTMSYELNFTYINMYDKLIDEDGNLKLEYTKEGLHMTDEGYEVITNVIKSYIEND